MKTVFISISILCLAQIGFSQTSITPIVGFEYFNIRDKYTRPSGYLPIFASSPKETKTLHFGILVSKTVTKDYSMRMTINYSKSQEGIWERAGYHRTNGIKFQTIKNSLQLSRNFFDIIDLSAGLGLNLIYDIKNISPHPSLEETIVNGRVFDPGLTFGIGLSKWGIISDFHFYQGVFARKFWYFEAKPIQIWRFSLGYEFRF
ncbi:MAG: hypothetical protein KDC24_03895 [Saprospiraceae bacterium]|nr:hypothetical protein [Saprospiraceae bacterium]